MSVRLAFNKQENFSHGIGTLFQPDMILQDPLRPKKRVLSNWYIIKLFCFGILVFSEDIKLAKTLPNIATFPLHRPWLNKSMDDSWVTVSKMTILQVFIWPFLCWSKLTDRWLKGIVHLQMLVSIDFHGMKKHYASYWGPTEGDLFKYSFYMMSMFLKCKKTKVKTKIICLNKEKTCC